MSDSKEGSWHETGQAFSNKVLPNSSLCDEFQLLSHEIRQAFSVLTRPDIVESGETKSLLLSLGHII